MRNCYNCKYKVTDAFWIERFKGEHFFSLSLWAKRFMRGEYYFCKKQRARIHCPLRDCPKFEQSLICKFFGDRTPEIHKEKDLVGGCEE